MRPGAPAHAGAPSVVESGAAALDAPPSQDERLFAALAYLSYFVGFWFIGPLAVYGMKGRQSPYVRFHAGQALVATMAVVASFTIGLVLFIVAGVVIFAVVSASDLGRANEQALEVAMSIARMVVVAGLTLLPTALVALCAVAAYRGRTKPLPVVGRFARAIQEPLFRLVDGLIGGGAGGAVGGGSAPPR